MVFKENSRGTDGDESSNSNANSDSEYKDATTIDASKIKLFNRSESFRSLESASRVLIPAIYNHSINDVIYQEKAGNSSDARNRATKRVEANLVKRVSPKAAYRKSKLRAHVQYDEVTGELITGAHPCHRECVEGDEPMICHYHFNLEWYQTMSKACYDCPYNISDCSRIDCIPADGISRPLNVVNRKMPGPAIEVRHLTQLCFRTFMRFHPTVYKNHTHP